MRYTAGHVHKNALDSTIPCCPGTSMPISIICTGCGKRLRANERLAGRTMPCPVCAAPLLIGSAEDAAAAMLLAESAPPQAPESEPPPREEVAAVRRSEAPLPSAARPDRPRKESAASTPVHALPPLTAKEPPFWLRHLHWLLVLSLIPLAVQLLRTPQEGDLLDRIYDAVDQAPEARRQVDVAIAQLLEGKGSLQKVFAVLPEHKLRGAFLPRDTWAHWLFTAGAAVLFLAFLLALTLEGTARPHHLVLTGLFTATAGILLLLALQVAAAWSQGVIVVPRSLFGILFWIVKMIGFSYQAAMDPENGFWLSFLGFTFGVGLCEELCKALPVLYHYRRANDQSWKGAFLWGLASGAGFGLAEGVAYASDFYNGISGADIYFVRNLSCVALHALWTGSAAITIHQRQHLFQQELAWYDLLVRAIAVVAVSAVLHGLYDTLLKKDMNALALGVAVLSFAYLAFQISRLRGADDQAAHAEMLQEYQRRRKAMQRM
jgi:RsiW-degrading membrane proteinase PrsW (M82 family)